MFIKFPEIINNFDYQFNSMTNMIFEKANYFFNGNDSGLLTRKTAYIFLFASNSWVCFMSFALRMIKLYIFLIWTS